MSKGRLEYLKRLFQHLQNQSEDCLYLNIYAPIQTSNTKVVDKGPMKYPVMVFVHGESYEWNSGNPYEGAVLASFGQILVVTINYRLGILGFLNANTNRYLKSPANYGLMDIIAALHWIQENISSVRGDPTSVTLAGHGTVLRVFTFLYPPVLFLKVCLLFHRAILMSGSGLAPWSLVGDPARQAAIVSHHVKCSPDLPHSLLMKCLREKPLVDLLATPVRSSYFSNSFGPTVDGVVIGLLFHRAILMSGSGLAPWSLVGDPARQAAIVSHHVKCSPDLPHSLLMKCLREKPLVDLLATPVRSSYFSNSFGPTVDGVVIV
uniref:Carboxylesterase type B domain-containing protein n=1 Tax=Lutzomyia longipalpis TaxID=7200 RepID=A0A1B0CQN5_LUTLO